MKEPDTVRRTAEIEEITNLHLIHPLASLLVPLFARLGVTPNAVSILGMLFGILAGVAYERYPHPPFAVLGFLLMIAWHVMDGADGQLARLTKTYSRLGKVLDGISDNVTFLAVYVGLAIALSRRYGAAAFALVAVAGLCHAIQAATYEVQRHEYDFWAWQKSSEPPQADSPARPGKPTTPLAQLIDFLDRLFYAGLGFPAAATTRTFRARMTAALERQPALAPVIRERYRDTFAPLLRRWSILSANYRTLGIFITALLGAPEYYFWLEIVGFTAVLVLLLWAQRALGDRFFGTLGALETLPLQ